MLYVQFNHKEKDGNGLLINHVALVTCRKKCYFQEEMSEPVIFL